MKNPVKKPSWWDEFAAFAIKGNAMALAVGTIIGAAFSTITKSLTDDIIMPIVSIFMGGIDSWRMIVNTDYGMPLVPEKKYPRSETVDFQRGEVEWEGGNLYFPQWSYHMDIDYLNY